MVDTLVQTAFCFDCTAVEWELLREGFALSLELGLEMNPELRSPAFRAIFASDGIDAWQPFRELFDDPAYPDFGADFAGGADAEGQAWHAVISAEMSFDALATARLIQRCCVETLAKGPIGFQWAITCSRPQIDEFGGGWCAVFADRIEIENTHTALAAALADDAGNRSG